MRLKNTLLIFLITILATSCRYYTGHIMFQTEESILVDSLALLSTEKNYVIQPGDLFELKVSGNNGEMIIDPDNLLKRELDLLQIRQNSNEINYLVQANGEVKFPVINNQKITGLTVYEANAFLSQQFSNFYTNSFVDLTLLNRRVVVFGPSGGQIIPLENENMNLLEILALSKEVSSRAYSDNIRLIRGDLKNPNVQVIDLSTIEGMRKANLKIRANDIIYVETKRVLAGQALRENILPYVTILTSITQAVLLYLTLKP